jgi:PadR family transcriptional regulator, regulatory protein AphA
MSSMYLLDMSSLSPTARVILGFLGLGPRSGYDIKRLADVSTRFFWGASYGQIYPELRRLEEQGLVEADEPTGARRRRPYRLTASGERALRDWLTADGGLAFEYRDEGLLKFFFGDYLSRDDALANLRRLGERHEAVLAHFRQIAADLEDERERDEAEFPYLALEYGIEFMEWVSGWCRRMEERLTRSRAR